MNKFLRQADKYGVEPLTPKPHPNFQCSGGDQIALCHLIFCLISSAPIFLSHAELHFKKHTLLVSFEGQNPYDIWNKIIVSNLYIYTHTFLCWLIPNAEAGTADECPSSDIWDANLHMLKIATICKVFSSRLPFRIMPAQWMTLQMLWTTHTICTCVCIFSYSVWGVPLLTVTNKNVCLIVVFCKVC